MLFILPFVSSNWQFNLYFKYFIVLQCFSRLDLYNSDLLADFGTLLITTYIYFSLDTAGMSIFFNV